MNIEETYQSAVDAHKSGDLTTAEAQYKAVLSASWEEPEALRLLGELYIQQARYVEAEPILHRALSLDPRNPAALMQLAVVCGWLGKQDDAIRYNDLCLQVCPDFPAAHWNRALWLLLHGEYKEGWEEYRWGTVTGSRPVRHVQPEWSGLGQEYPKSLYVWAEQGLGDTLMMLRFLAELRRAFPIGRIVLEVQRPLLQLVGAQGYPVNRVVAAQPDGAFAERCDAHISLMSLPRILGVRPESIPSTPYVKAPESWCRDGAVKQIGICWKGSTGHQNDRHRSASKESFLSGIFADPSRIDFPLDNVKWQSLVPSETLFSNMMVLPCGVDISETATVIDSLDLVITVDTMVAHLAGAMGKPVWILLPPNCDWRWLRNWNSDNTTSPWYSTARLYRQSKFGDWHNAIRGVSHSLCALSNRRVTEPALT